MFYPRMVSLRYEELMCKNQQHNNSFLACSDFCCLLITFANSLDTDQDRQNVGPDLDPNYFYILIVFLKEFFEKVNFEKSHQMTTKALGVQWLSGRVLDWRLKGRGFEPHRRHCIVSLSKTHLS